MREVRLLRHPIPTEPLGDDPVRFLANLGIDVDNPTTWSLATFTNDVSREVSTDQLFDRALNLALLDGRRIRPDLFVYRHGNHVPSYSQVDGQRVPIEAQFRKAFVYGMVSHALARDQEDVQDQRSNLFQGVFYSILAGNGMAMIGGGTPGPKQAPAGVSLPS